MSETRKLAAILVADVVGYSRLVRADEDRTLARLRGLRSDLIDPAIAAHHGRIVKRTGDGSIIEFRSIVDAVRCAIEVQNGLIVRNASVPDDERIQFRVGIHVGDVVEEADGDLMGDGVNIAARLESVAKPGAICLSEQAYWQVKGRLDLKVTDLGNTELKNIAEPIRVYSLEVGQPAQAKLRQPAPASIAASATAAQRARSVSSRWPAFVVALALALIAAGGYAWHAGLAPRLLGSMVDDNLAHAPRLSIVVLPFENLSGDKEQDYFADRITDDLTTDLSHLPDSFVISRGTAFTYKGKAVDAKQIAKDLGVRYLLEGSVRRVGDNVEVNAHLISTETGAHVWADRFEGDRSKLGELQIEFVSRLANSLGMELVKAEALRAMRERPNDPDAVDLAMRGQAILYSNPSTAAFGEATALFERALALDPQNLPAVTGLANALAAHTILTHDAGDAARAEKLIDTALALQPDNSTAHRTKGLILGFVKHEMRPAIAEAERAIALDPNDADAHAEAGLWKGSLGHVEDGISGVETALRLSPRDRDVPIWQYYMCALHDYLQHWEQAIEWCEKSRAGWPDNFSTYVHLAAAHALAGRDKEAKDAAAQLQKVYPGFTVQTYADLASRNYDPTYKAAIARTIEGLRKAGLPEGEQ
jgi:class 3 adenylate cyclase/TolB-like protein/Tfp pilus assembly protein PilF